MPDTTSSHASSQARQGLCRPLAEALRHAGLEAGIKAMHPMADTGLAHHHVWLEREQIDWVARLPKQSQMGLAPTANLDYQAACFARASQGGHAPALHGILPPSPALPRGGLLVSAIRGRPARLPEDLPAIAEALASFHVLDLPETRARPPLLSPADPWAAMLEEVRGQARFLDEAGLDADARQLIEAELTALPQHLPQGPGAEPRLISFDAHPGNFLTTESGCAVLVDLEKCRYGLSGFDLAHASLYTSTTWDLDSYAELTPAEVVAFYRHWMARTGLTDTRNLLNCRRAMWLWSLTWCAKWRTSHRLERDASAGGEDWSSELSDDALVAHVRDRVDHYLSTATIERVQREFGTLEKALTDRDRTTDGRA
ncbi:aminoglycoside phosphotransferase family protein [Halomonas daqiaonensis]|uniref:Phosphotransferase enzyme family protein n=1 Tax=Halomonas daqiaonensis TaxID=650850 RepID=A0A1H7LY94_9GAMM|nr:aminoglycoside phosphotransferase family protein [Halomonas daqiaonensis]SEL03904.1 Phosphotransferase enzyme family protein [Halomonas daqiaonensis]